MENSNIKNEIDELAAKIPTSVEIPTGNTQPKTKGAFKAELNGIYLSMSDHNLLANLLGEVDDTNDLLRDIKFTLERILEAVKSRE